MGLNEYMCSHYARFSFENGISWSDSDDNYLFYPSIKLISRYLHISSRFSVQINFFLHISFFMLHWILRSNLYDKHSSRQYIIPHIHLRV